MSSLLNHIDNNRSEDDEDDHINRLFPKCKPRASSLSLSPSLQHISNESTSTSSTSASDLCLTTEGSGRYGEVNHNCNSTRSSKSIYRYKSSSTNSLRRNSNNSHNSQNPKEIHLKSTYCSQHNQAFEEISASPIVGYQEFVLNNNNTDCRSDFLNKPTSTPLYLSVDSSRKEITHKGFPGRHRRSDTHNFNQKNVARNLKSDREQSQSNGNNSISQRNGFHRQPVTSVTSTRPTANSSLGQKSDRTYSHQNFLVATPVILPSQTKVKSGHGLYENSEEKLSFSDKDKVTKNIDLSLTSTVAASDLLINMECNSVEANFDNGIGSSSCHRSSGESTNGSNTNDFIESMGIRGPAALSNSGNGFPSTGLVPSIGSLRDSRIEIAGGREVFSQNRIRAGRRHRGIAHASSNAEVMADTTNSANCSSNKMRKKSLHSHSAYQHHQQHHCCRPTNPCRGVSPTCPEVSLPGSIVWEPNHTCSRRSAEVVGNRQQYLNHSHSLGGPSQCVKCSHSCGCCGHHGLDYSKSYNADFEIGGSRPPPNFPQLHGPGATSPVPMRETIFSSDVRSVEKSSTSHFQGVETAKQVHCDMRSPDQDEPLIYEAVVGSGEVVFDDIGEWRERNVDDNPVECGYDGGDEHDLSEVQAIKKIQSQSSPCSSKGLGISLNSSTVSKSKPNAFASSTVDLIDGSPCTSNKDGNTTPSGYESDECSASVGNNSIVTHPLQHIKGSPNSGNQRIIGSIPIADYEGSPKRYGLKQQMQPVVGEAHFHLVDVVRSELNTETEHNLIGREQRAQSLIDQTIAAGTSSSSSSLDNTNTNVSSNSSSRTNNRISPRALSPSHPIAGLATRFPGFPQRVNAPISAKQNTLIQTPHLSPNYENSLMGLRSRVVSEIEDLQTCHTQDSVFNSESRSNQTDALAEFIPNLSIDSADSQFISTTKNNLDYSPDDSVTSQQGSINTTVSTASEQEHGFRRVAQLIEETKSKDLVGVSSDSSFTTVVPLSQDLLYEFSETRKVLEEFFHTTGNASVEQCKADRTVFDELDYTLKRQAGNSYVGQRLAGDFAGNLIAEDSPKKPPRRGVLLLGSDGDGSDEKGSPKLISFQEISVPPMHSMSPKIHHQYRLSLNSMQSHSLLATNRSLRSPKSHSRSQSQSPPAHDPTRDINDNDIDVETASTNTETDLGDTEVGMQVGHSRNFTLSPETTDCDSNELESELSLDYEASLPSSSRVGVTMPIVEDGLSSGNDSENEDIIEVDVSYRNEYCYLSGSDIKTGYQNVGFQQGNGTILPLYQNNKDGLAAFFNGDSIQTGLLDWNCPSLQIKNSSVSLTSEDRHTITGENNSSCADPNPTLSLMKKQISEIEKEIQMRASQQTQKLQQTQTEAFVERETGGSSNEVLGNSDHPTIPFAGVEKQSAEGNELVSEHSTTKRGNGGTGTELLYLKQSTKVKSNPGGKSEVMKTDNSLFVNHDPELDALDPMRPTPPPSPAPGFIIRQQQPNTRSWKSPQEAERKSNSNIPSSHASNCERITESNTSTSGMTTSNSCGSLAHTTPPATTIAATIQDIKDAIQRTKPIPHQRQFEHSLLNSSVDSSPSANITPCVQNQSRLALQHPHQFSKSQEQVEPLICDSSPVWVPRQSNSGRCLDQRMENLDSSEARDPLLKKQRYDDTPDDDADTDQETDRLLGQTRTEDDYGFYDEKDCWKKTKSRSLLPAINKGVNFVKSAASSVPLQLSSQQPLLSTSVSISSCNAVFSGIAAGHLANPSSSGPISSSSSGTNNTNHHNNPYNPNNHSSAALVPLTSTTYSSSSSSSSSQHLIHSSAPTSPFDESQVQLPSSTTAGSCKSKKEKDGVKKKRSKEDFLKNPSVLIEGVLFRARYLGSTQLVCEGQPTKATRMMQAEEAVSRIKAHATEIDTVSSVTNEGASNLTSPTSNVSSKLLSTSLSQKPEEFRPLPPSTNLVVHHGTDLEESLRVASNLRRKIEEDMEDYFYPEDDSCCEEESLDEADGDEDLFEQSPHQSTGSRSSLRDNNKGIRLPLEDINGSSNALQIHDNHRHPLSLHHNRQSVGSSGGENQVGGILHLSPPCGSALPGTMFRLRFVGSLEVDEEIGMGKRRRKRPKKAMVEEAVMKLKAPEGETQPSTEVDLFISTEKIMVLNTDLKEIMMDHALRTISYIADIGDLVVLMARRRPVPTDTIDETKPPRPPKMICHVFESDEAQYIAQSIGQAFQVAYMEFLKANGIEDSSFVREMDYQEVLNSQEIFGDELQMFAKKELQKEVVVPKSKGEILGVVIVESGWGSMLPTVVIANLAPAGAASRCGQLNIGDQIIAINGVSLVGLPLSTCQNYIKNTKSQTVVKLTVVPCPPVVEVKIKRPDTKYQLGFSVQNGVICSLLRGGIAERGGVRVGHRIIEINSQSVVAVPHEKIVNLLATSVGEINMKTMPTSMFRLLTGQENPLYI